MRQTLDLIGRSRIYCSRSRASPVYKRDARASLGRDLPNQISLKLVSKLDVPFLLNEIFSENAYLQHGVKLQEGYTVVDVGANIGLFTLQAADLVGQQVIGCPA